MSNGDPGSIPGRCQTIIHLCEKKLKEVRMKKIVSTFFAVGAIITYGLAIGAFFIASEQEAMFLTLGLLGAVYAGLYVLVQKV